MSRSFSFWQFAGFVFTSAVGTLLHFLYDLSGQKVVVGLFSAVNESIWEHMKLLFFPMLAFAVLQWLGIGKTRADYWCVVLVGILTGTLLIPVLYYTYTGAFGVMSDVVNITIFFVTAAVVYALQSYFFKRENRCRIPSLLAIAILCGIAVLFWVFTFVPPAIPLFEDPVKNACRVLQNRKECCILLKNV